MPEFPAPPSPTSSARPGAHPAEDLGNTIRGLGYGSLRSSPTPCLAGPERYLTTLPLGEGGMGKVSEATDLQFGRVVAVKELIPGSAIDEARFTREALITANLEHPCIPAVYERGIRADGTPFYAMRRVLGRTLTTVVRETRTLKERLKLLPVVVQVAQTLAFAHERGVLHRDIKPSNVMVGVHGEVTLLDWGIAKVRGLPTEANESALPAPTTDGEDLTGHGAVIGTPSYMSPEQASGRLDAIDERADIFSLGALLYFVLSGRAPYRAPTQEGVVSLAIEARPPPLEEVAPHAPAALCATVRRAMAPRPADRFQSAAEVAEAIEGVAADAMAEKPSRSVAIFTGGSLLALLSLAAYASLAIWQMAPTLRELGSGAWVYLLPTGLGCALSLIEWRTQGRYSLGTVALMLTGFSLLGALSATATGLTLTLRHATSPPVFDDLLQFREFLTQGVYESMGNLTVGAPLAALQLILWGSVRRQVETRRRSPGAI